MSDSLRPHELQHARPPCPSPTPGVHPNSCPSSQFCYPAISSSVIPFSSCPQSLPASESFPMSQLFTWGGQSIGKCKSNHNYIILHIHLDGYYQERKQKIHVSRDVERLEPLCSVWGSVKWSSHGGKQYGSSSKKLNIELPHHMIQKLHFWVYTQKNYSRDMRKYLYTNVHSNIIYNSQKVKTTQVSINRWMDMQNIVYTCSAILFSL